MKFDAVAFWTLASDPSEAYRTAFAYTEQVCAAFEISTALRGAHFLAQVLQETGGLRHTEESLHYSAARLMVVWPSRFPTLESAQPFAGNPRALANKVYGGRNGNVFPDDGWTFIGRGLLQLTGRGSYEAVGKLLGIQLAEYPHLATTPDLALPIAACAWQIRGCNEAADRDDVVEVTKRVNGGRHGMELRRAWLVKTRAVVSD